MPDFDQFWQWYPRKIAKQPARKAYEKAVKKRTPEQLLTAVKGLWGQFRDKDKQFCPHAATWLNQERWTDYEPDETPKLEVVHEPLELVHTGLTQDTLIRARKAQNTLIALIGEGQYRAWFARVRVAEPDEGVPVYKADTPYTAFHIRNNFMPQIERAWGEPVEVVV